MSGFAKNLSGTNVLDFIKLTDFIRSLLLFAYGFWVLPAESNSALKLDLC